MVKAVLVASPLVLPSMLLAQQPRGEHTTTGASASGIKVLTRAEFDALLATPESVLLVDVRRPDEVQNNGGFGAYFSVSLADLERYVSFIPKDRAIVTVSNHARRAEQAAAVLQRHGFVIAGAIGTQSYEAEGGAIVKVPVPLPAVPAGK